MSNCCPNILKSSKLERLSRKELDEQASKISGRSAGLHTYTPLSHENLLRKFSKLASQGGDLTKLKQENERLKAELQMTKGEMSRKEKRIYSLELTLKNIDGKKQVKIESQQAFRSHSTDRDMDRLEPSSYEHEFGNSEEILRNHFLEVIRRHHIVLQQKDDVICRLQEELARFREQDKAGQQQPSQQIWTHDFHTHSSIEAERLRRTEAAIKVMGDDLSLAKAQLQRPPLGEERFTPSSPRDRMVVQELLRRNRFGVIADIEKMGQRFLEKLELEEKLDRLHWQIETRRFQTYKEREGKKFTPECTYNKEFEMLATTRNNMLNALKTLRANEGDVAVKEGLEHDHQKVVNFEENIFLNTIQTIYNPLTGYYTSSESGRTMSHQEWPEK